MSDMNARLKPWKDLGISPAVMRTIAAPMPRAAARTLAVTGATEKQRALNAMAQAVRAATPAILAANDEDVAAAEKAGTPRRSSTGSSLISGRIASHCGRHRYGSPH